MKTKTQIAIEKGTTIYNKSVVSDIREYKYKLLKPAAQNSKLGGKTKVWTKGQYIGMPLYALSLEERATCPSTCNAWDICYGNNMPFATRFNPLKNTATFTDRLSAELDAFDKKFPKGYSLRLHVIGDFYSTAYVSFWRVQLKNRPGLNIFGYTHRQGNIRKSINNVWKTYQHRFNILQSDGWPSNDGRRPVAMLETTPMAEQLPVCPEQTGKVIGCMDCGLCTNPKILGVKWLVH